MDKFYDAVIDFNVNITLFNVKDRDYVEEQIEIFKDRIFNASNLDCITDCNIREEWVDMFECK